MQELARTTMTTDGMKNTEEGEGFLYIYTQTRHRHGEGERGGATEGRFGSGK